MLFFSDSNQHLSSLVLAAQNIRSNIEHGATVLQSYVSSLQVRTDTKLSLLLGILLGLSVVAAIAAHPRKPIDYTGVGIDLPPEMRGEETVGVAKKVDEAGSVGAVDEQKPAGLQQIQGVVDNLSQLRRRKRAKNPPSAAAAGEESLVNTTTESQIKETGNAGDEAGRAEWDASRLDEDKLARKIGSSKAARMLGLTEDQVRQAVADAKQELEQSNSGPAGGFPSRENHDDGVGFSGFLFLAMLLVGLWALWAHLSAYPHGTLSRFLVGVLPREMETLGLA
ncbi:unnamed protein product [Ectocarpus sp. 12 AP-2014]